MLLLGDSSTLSWSLHDTDRTLLTTMLEQRLGNVVALSGPGFGAPIYNEALRILSTLDNRPKAVVFTCALRTSTATHILNDPVIGHHRSHAALAKVPDARRPIRYVGRGGTSSALAEREAFLNLTVDSRWSGVHTIRHYRDQLVGLSLPPWPLELEKVRFDYFYGEQLAPDSPRLQTLVTLAERLEAYGVPAVGMWTKPPIQRGEMHFPGEFETHVRSQLAVHNDALARGSHAAGALMDVPLADEDFEDSRNATEHYSYPGRVKVADAIAEAVRSR